MRRMMMITPRVMAMASSDATGATARRVVSSWTGTHSHSCRVLSTQAVAAEVEAIAPDNEGNEYVAPVKTPKRQRPGSRLKDLQEKLRKEDEEGRNRSLLRANNGRCETGESSFVQASEATVERTESSSLQHHEQLKGLQRPKPLDGKMLTDSFGRHHSYLRISLVEKCNLRCQYCMPSEGLPDLHSPEQLLTADEIVTLAQLFIQAGVDKIRLTGGEPLLRSPPEVMHIIQSLAPQVQSVGLTTNGLLVPRHFHNLVDAGLTHMNISLDTLRPDRFLEITRRRGFDRVRQALELVSSHEQFSSHPGRLKLNCVVMRHFNDDELGDFVRLTRDKVMDVRFIEWMPFLDNGWNRDRFVSYAEMKSRILQQHLGLVRLEDGPNDTTKWWGVPGYKGRIGFITSMSQHFCATCNRLRLTADGKLKACLFGSAETNLRDALRQQQQQDRELSLETLIESAVKAKTFALGGHGTADAIAKANDNRPMTTIGG